MSSSQSEVSTFPNPDLLGQIKCLSEHISLAKSQGSDYEKSMPKPSSAEIEFCILSLWSSLPPLRNPFRVDQTPGPNQKFEAESVGTMYDHIKIYCTKTDDDIKAHEEPNPKENSYTPEDLEIIYNVFIEAVCHATYDNVASTFRSCKLEVDCYPWQARDNDHTGFQWAVALAIAALELDDVFAKVKTPSRRLIEAQEGVRGKLGRRKFELEWAFGKAKGLSGVA